MKISFPLLATLFAPLVVDAGLTVTNTKTDLREITLDYGPLTTDYEFGQGFRAPDGTIRETIETEKVAFFGDDLGGQNGYEARETRTQFQSWDGATYIERDGVVYQYSARGGFSADLAFGNSFSINSDQDFVFEYSTSNSINDFLPALGVSAFSVFDENSQSQLSDLNDLSPDSTFQINQPGYTLSVASDFEDFNALIEFIVLLEEGAGSVDFSVDFLLDLAHSQSGDLSQSSEWFGANHGVIISSDMAATVPEPSSFAFIFCGIILTLTWLRRVRTQLSVSRVGSVVQSS